MKKSTVALVLTNLVVVSCTIVLLASPGREHDLLRAIAEQSQTSQGYRLVFVGRSEDCAADLLVMHLIAKPAFRGRVSGLVAYVGPESHLESVMHSVRSRGLQVEVVPLSDKPRAGPLIGYPSLPYVVVLDREDRVRLASAVPRTSFERAAFERMLALLIADGDTAS